MNKTPKDQIYAQPLKEIKEFEFNDQVAGVFDDMIKRSVPGYQLIIENIGILASRFYQENTFCYDLGTSLGEAILSILGSVPNPHLNIIAVDNSKPMLSKCQKRVRSKYPEAQVTYLCENISNTHIEHASIVMLNFTLQFIQLTERQKIIDKIFDGLVPGGILILSEKIKFEREEHQIKFADLYHDFKMARGYSELEIAQKRTALEKVLVPETINAHMERLSNAGFTEKYIWLQLFNFISIVAFK